MALDDIDHDRRKGSCRFHSQYRARLVPGRRIAHRFVSSNRIDPAKPSPGRRPMKAGEPDQTWAEAEPARSPSLILNQEEMGIIRPARRTYAEFLCRAARDRHRRNPAGGLHISASRE